MNVRSFTLCSQCSGCFCLRGCASNGPEPAAIAPDRARLVVTVKAEPKKGWRDPKTDSTYSDLSQIGQGKQFETVDYESLDEIVVWVEPSMAVRRKSERHDRPVVSERGAASRARGRGLVLQGRRGAYLRTEDGRVMNLSSSSRPNVCGLVEVMVDSQAEPIARIYVTPTHFAQVGQSGKKLSFRRSSAGTGEGRLLAPSPAGDADQRGPGRRQEHVRHAHRWGQHAAENPVNSSHALQHEDPAADAGDHGGSRRHRRAGVAQGDDDAETHGRRSAIIERAADNYLRQLDATSSGRPNRRCTGRPPTSDRCSTPSRPMHRRTTGERPGADWRGRFSGELLQKRLGLAVISGPGESRRDELRGHGGDDQPGKQRWRS